MTDGTVSRLNSARKALLAIAGVTAVMIPVLVGVANSPTASAQTSHAAKSATVPQWETAAGGQMGFEVASIRQSPPGKFTPPNFPLDDGPAYASTGGRFSADFAVTTYNEFAYKIRLTGEQMQAMVANLPKWVVNDKFMIQAKAPKDNPTKDQMRLMMQSLLADHFHLSTHFETKEIPVFALGLVAPGKTGPNLRPHPEGPPCDPRVPEPTHGPQGRSDVFPAACEITEFEAHSERVLAGSRDTTMEMIAEDLPSLSLGRLDRRVVDRTGLRGKFDFRLEWRPEPNGSPTNADAESELATPTLLQALREQLGLKLKSTKSPIRTLVVDHITRPSEN